MVNRRIFALAAGLAVVTVPTVPAYAAKCGNNAAGFAHWVAVAKREAVGAGFSKRTIAATLGNVRYATRTISLDRNQRSFRYSLKTFMAKRGANTIVSKGRRLKKKNARLFARIEKQFGVSPGVLIAIWGMETAFGRFQGNQDSISSLATLAYDCRRSAFFQKELYAAMTIIQRGEMSRKQMRGAGHGEIGQTQFLPSNYVKYAVDYDGNGRRDLIRSATDALASTANFLRAHGWKRGRGYQPGQGNFRAIQGWNAAGVYQKAIAIIAANIDK